MYNERLAARRGALARWRNLDERIANLRLVVFVLGVVVGIASFALDLIAGPWLVAPFVGFISLVVWHAYVIRSARTVEIAVEYYLRALSRLDGTWPGTGNQRCDLVDDEHPYAADLDLFGHGSMFELLCNARTQAGERSLAAWLAAPASKEVVCGRQAAVDELRDRIDLREDLAMLGRDVGEFVHPDALIAWGERPSPFSPAVARWARIAAWMLASAAVGSVVAWALTPVGPWPLIVVIVLEWVTGRLLRDRLDAVLAGVQQPEEELVVLARVLDRMQQERLQSPRLAVLRQQLLTGNIVASVSIAALERRISWLNAQRNQFFAPFAYLLMWGVHFGLAIEGWRRQYGTQIRFWLDAVGELEALCDLSGYAFEHPADPFPEIRDCGPYFEGEEIGHPLLVETDCVRNSVRLDGECRAMIVSGSNMSGKTTLLRTVGINAVLALAGAPVRAKRLVLSELKVGATIRIHDSIQKGRSRFYSEIKRLQTLMEISRKGDGKLLFLLDEILHGTNSHDRRVGGEAVLRSFIDARGIGLVTTHDLALAGIADSLSPRAVNVHFADTLEQGKLHFDYVMRPGVVTRSNALELMRSVGLDV
ncbi:MAG: hypothetical protein A2289_08095 [Deltaproteobacteria bacterium RIFOXYA12_FULL_58_15]|nr:MAG: hypothetical protein A2289_08095 [Deltaproteobacteria bacterium RIFOXYA12_FULL_58_15]OGR09499.1 MAG: hypothetical protein A2341_01670 [Deltaproteobacteria bacterium RIFOXYB12_FULL_58_9]